MKGPICLLDLIAGSFVRSPGTLIFTQGVMYGAGFILFYYLILSMVNEYWITRQGSAYGPDLQRLRRLRRSHAFRRRGVDARVRLPDDVPHCSCYWPCRYHWTADIAPETATAGDGSECACAGALDFPALFSVLGVLALQLRHGHGLFVPLAVHALLRTGKRNKLDIGGVTAGSDGNVTGCRSDEFRVLVGSEDVDWCAARVLECGCGGGGVCLLGAGEEFWGVGGVLRWFMGSLGLSIRLCGFVHRLQSITTQF